MTLLCYGQRDFPAQAVVSRLLAALPDPPHRLIIPHGGHQNAVASALVDIASERKWPSVQVPCRDKVQLATVFATFRAIDRVYLFHDKITESEVGACILRHAEAQGLWRALVLSSGSVMLGS